MNHFCVILCRASSDDVKLNEAFYEFTKWYMTFILKYTESDKWEVQGRKVEM